MFQAELAGTGSYLPEKILTNFDLEKQLDTSDEWIRTRTGIVERRIAGKEESSSVLAAHAARKALESAKIKAEELDIIILCTSTPDVLPVRRIDLVIRPIGDEGRYVVKDPQRRDYFELGEEENFLLAQLDGQQDAPAICTARDGLLTQLEEKYGEVPVAIGVANGALIELLTAKDGITWTIILTSPKGMSCLIASGEGWRPLAPAPTGPSV